MNAVIGLGNIGEEYQNTRHNVGFMVVDEVNQRHSGKFSKEAPLYFSSRVRIRNQHTLLIKPTTYMNASGRAVKRLLQRHQNIELHRVLVVLDDINLPFGTLRLRPSGSDGGQKGLRSIIEALQTTEIPRLRIGIGNQVVDAVRYVLSPFSSAQKKFLPEVISWAADAVESFVLQGIQVTMTRFNRNILNNTEEDSN